MIRRFLTLGSQIELRAEPSKNTAKDEIELLLPIDVFWEVKELVRLIRYSSSGDIASSRFWQSLANLVRPYIVSEPQRIWFCKNIGP